MWDDERSERLIKEVWHFMRYGPAVGRKQIAMGNVEFQEWLVLKPALLLIKAERHLMDSPPTRS